MSIREVVFISPPNESPAIYWMSGHVSDEKFLLMTSVLDIDIDVSEIKREWGTRKLEFIILYISDEPLPNYEPITYWLAAETIPA